MTIAGKSLTFYLYIGIHFAAIAGAFFVPFTWNMVLLFGLTYFFLMFFVTAGYHRYFSHRSYKLDRVPQFLMAWLAMTSGQKGILWWAATHRDHHIHSDDERDFHSPVQYGFWQSHIGWIFMPETQTYNPKKIQDFGKYAELRFLDKYHWLPTVAYAVFISLLGGFTTTEHTFWGAAMRNLVWGYALPILFCYQISYTVNSFAHVYGKRRFETSDDSRNNWFIAIFTLGEGWHNNHHYCKSSCRQGYKWYEYDFTFYLLNVLKWVGIVKDMRPFRVENTKGVMVEAKSPEQQFNPVPAEA